MMKGAPDAPFISAVEPLRLRVPAAPALCDLAFTFQAGKNAVEVVLLDPHLRGQLGDRDARLPFHEGERFDCAGPAPFTASSAAASRCAGRFAFGFRRSPRPRRGGGSGGGGGGG